MIFLWGKNLSLKECYVALTIIQMSLHYTENKDNREIWGGGGVFFLKINLSISLTKSQYLNSIIFANKFYLEFIKEILRNPLKVKKKNSICSCFLPF